MCQYSVQMKDGLIQGFGAQVGDSASCPYCASSPINRVCYVQRKFIEEIHIWVLGQGIKTLLWLSALKEQINHMRGIDEWSIHKMKGEGGGIQQKQMGLSPAIFLENLQYLLEV